MKLLFSSIAAGAILLFSSSAYSSVVIGGYSSGFFDNPVEQSNSVFSGIGTDIFKYGKNPYMKGGTSILKYTGNKFEIKGPAKKFKIGTLSFFNGTSLVDTSVDGVDLNVDVSAPLDQSFTFGLGLNQTLNSLNPNSDQVNLPAPYTSTETFDFGGDKFFFMAIFGEFVDGVFEEVSYLDVGEKKYGSVDLYGMFTPVPVPAAFWLFGSALATLFVTRRKATV